jgi:hypothetical protein
MTHEPPGRLLGGLLVASLAMLGLLLATWLPTDLFASLLPPPHPPPSPQGQSIYAYVTLKEKAKHDEAMRNALRDHVRAVIGPFAVPDVIHWVGGPADQLPACRAVPCCPAALGALHCQVPSCCLLCAG